MEIVYNSTNQFEKDLKKLSPEEKKRVVVAINRLGADLQNNSRGYSNKLIRPLNIELPEGQDSTLYVFKATPKARIILTIDPDPLFDQTIILLIKVVSRKDMSKAFKGIAESIYQKKLGEDSENGRD